MRELRDTEQAEHARQLKMWSDQLADHPDPVVRVYGPLYEAIWKMTEPTTLEEYEPAFHAAVIATEAVAERAAAFRCRRKLQPAAGAGTKIFPPTYAGAVYNVELRRVPGHDEPMPCVVVDSVQSQANRMEEALQQAIDEGRITIPLVRVKFEATADARVDVVCRWLSAGQ